MSVKQIRENGSATERWLLAAALIIIVLLANNARYLPLYPDEIAYKIFLERFFLNGGFKQSLTPYCTQGFLADIPLPLIPAAIFWSALRWFGSGWLSYRLVPLAALGATIGLLTVNGWRKGDVGIWRTLLLIATGPAVYGLVILRPEILTLFGGLVLFLLARRLSEPASTSTILVSTVISLFVFSLVAFVHPKALYLSPLLLIGLYFGSCGIKTNKYRLVLFGCMTLVAFSLIISALSLHQLQFLTCPEVPAIERNMSIQSVNIVDAILRPCRFLSTLKIAFSAETFSATITQVQFKPNYPFNYLPDSISGDLLTNITNVAILAGLASAIIYIMVKFFLLACTSRDTKTRKELILIAALGAGFGTPMAFNLTRYWYEIAFMIGGITLLAALIRPIPLSWSGLRPFQPAFDIVAGIGTFIIAILTLVVIQTLLTPKLMKGFEGPGVTIFTDQARVAVAVSNLLVKYKIETSEPIILDDNTYETLSSHPVVIPITYLGKAFPSVDLLKATLARNGVHFSLTACNVTSILTALKWKLLEETGGVDGKSFCLFTDKDGPAAR